MEKNARITYIDTIRLLATIAVVLTHVASIHIEDLSPNTLEWQVHNIYGAVSRWCVPVFVMISGALFLDKGKTWNIEKLYKKNISRIVISLIAWSLIYAFFQYITLPRYHNIISIFGLTIIGHYHLWFLYMILGIYLVLPILKTISENRNILCYFLLLSLFFVFINPTVIHFSNSILPQQIIAYFDTHPYFLDALSTNYQHLTPKVLLGYSFYFLLGHYLNTTNISKKYLLILGLLGFLYIFTFTFLYSDKEGCFYGDFYHYLSIGPILESVFVFCAIKDSLVLNSLSSNIFNKTSFGIYLIHPMIIESLLLLDIDTLSFPPIIWIPCMVIIVYILSFSIISILIRIPLFSKYCL